MINIGGNRNYRAIFLYLVQFYKYVYILFRINLQGNHGKLTSIGRRSARAQLSAVSSGPASAGLTNNVAANSNEATPITEPLAPPMGGAITWLLLELLTLDATGIPSGAPAEAIACVCVGYSEIWWRSRLTRRTGGCKNNKKNHI